jgi:hypothetical protein
MIDNLWTIEESLWLDGPETYRRQLHPDCVMVFPSPTGILSVERVLASLEGVPRWKNVEMKQRTAKQMRPDMAFLTYEARAEREQGPPYHAYCSSIYCLEDDRWRIVFHQQTPV